MNRGGKKRHRFGMAAVIFILIAVCISSCREEAQRKEGPDTVDLRQKGRKPGKEIPEITHISNLKDLPGASTVDQLIRKGNIAYKTAPDSAMAYFRQALQLSREINFPEGAAVSLLSLGTYAYNLRYNYTAARTFFYSALPYCIKADQQNPKILPGVYNSLGNTYFMEARYDSAIHFYYKSLQSLQGRTKADTPSLINAYLNLGAGMEVMDDGRNRTVYYLFKAYDLAAAYGKDTILMAGILENLSTIYNKNGLYDSALYYSLRFLTVNKQLGNPTTIQEAYARIGSCMLFKKDLVQAEYYLDSAKAVDKTLAEQNITLLQNYGCLQYYAGNFKEAIPFYEHALAVAFRKGYRKDQLNIFATLTNIYDTIGRRDLAFGYLKSFTLLRDTMLNEDNISTMNQYEIKYRTAEKDRDIIQKQLLIARQQNKIQQQYLWIGATLVAILALLGLFFRRRHKLALEQLRANLAGEEKERLRMAAELHDGIVSKLSSVKMSFDALSPAGVTGAAEGGEYLEALHLLEQSIVELRTTSQNLLPSILEKAGLVSAVRIYCQKINKTGELAIDFQVVGALPQLQQDFQLHIYRIVQELVSNIIKHAQATQAWVQFNVRNHHLHITVEDNGIGFDPQIQYEPNGIGWINLQNRLKLLNGNWEITTTRGTAIYMDFDMKPYTK